MMIILIIKERRNRTPNLAIRLKTGVDRKPHIYRHVIPAN
jgi:hypothetical protein